MSTVTQLPTMCNPDLLKEAELKQEVLRMQGEVVLMGDRLHNMNHLAHLQASFLEALVDSYDAGDMEAVSRQLDQFSERRKQFKAKGHSPIHH